MGSACTCLNVAMNIIHLDFCASANFILVFACLIYVCAANSLKDAGLTLENPKATLPDLYEASIAELQDGLQKGHFSSVDLVKGSMIFHYYRYN